MRSRKSVPMPLLKRCASGEESTSSPKAGELVPAPATRSGTRRHCRSISMAPAATGAPDSRVRLFQPLDRLGCGGLGLAFLASAAIHAWFIGVALGPRMAAWMGLYFLIQGALLALELPLRVQRWPTLAARVWTLAGVLLPAPLFVEPMLRLFATPALYV